MGFSWALYFFKRWWRFVYGHLVLSLDTLLMDRHRAPGMTRDSICFWVYVDGVCTVGCDRPKVLAAMKAVKATLGTAGLQCSEIESEKSRQVSTGLRLDYESGISSLEDSRIWRLRHGLEFAACQKQLTGDQVAKFNWSLHLELSAASPCPVPQQCWVSLYTYFRTSMRTVVACGCSGIQVDRVIASTLDVQLCRSLVTVGLRYRCLGRSIWVLRSYASLV